MKLSGWGKYPEAQASRLEFSGPRSLNEGLKSGGDCIARAMGRSYGDSSLAANVILMDKHTGILDFDAQNGLLACRSGMTLNRIIRKFLPKGWFLPVTPGTAYVSVGGAIASDVHGKNHHVDGCFSRWVEGFHLMTGDGCIHWCSEEENPRLFHATCGGMGLTGVILDAVIKLVRVPGAFISQTTIRRPNLKAVVEGFDRAEKYKYSVAWIDCLAKGPDLGRSVLFLGEHAPKNNFPLPDKPRLTVPFDMPGFFLNRLSISLFNKTYYAVHPNKQENQVVHLVPFFYPLDSIAHWNRMYGPRGFTQYQLVVPKTDGAYALKSILKRIVDSKFSPFLAVLKLFGPANENLLSFPLEGYTLAMDFPMRPGLLRFLEELDRLVPDCGGRLYLTKDARMSGATFRRTYPRLDKFEEIRRQTCACGVFNSLQSMRLEIA